MISVIIPAYNVEEYIAEAVTSVLNQSYKNLECIVVNDASTDNTEDAAIKAAKGDKRFRIISNVENKGVGITRSIGISSARGEYVMCLDGDDYYSDDYVKDLANEAKRTDADITSGGVTHLNYDGRRKKFTYGTDTIYGDGKVLDYWGKNIVYLNNRLIRKSLFDKVNHCKRRYIEDTPMIIPLLWYANKVAFVENAGYIYRFRKSSLTHTNDTLKDFIFKTLCVLDLLDFFRVHDPSMIDKIGLAGALASELESINKHAIQEAEIVKYQKEWLEVTRRVFNYIHIKQIIVNPKV